MGVGALSGVRGFSESVRAMLYSETRTIMAADLTARQFNEPSSSQMEQLEALRARGVDRTVITETVSMASSQVPDAVPVLVSVKAVDPAKYPYYGTVKLNPQMPIADALQSGTVIAGEDVLIRLGVKVGDTIRLGSQDFRMAAIVLSEPDRMSGSLNVGLRMMMSREAFERTGLMQLGSRAVTRFLFKIQPGGPSGRAARSPAGRFPPASSLDRPHPRHGHYISQHNQPDRVDRRIYRRRNGDVCASTTEDGQHRGDEIAGRNVERHYPDLHSADSAAWISRWYLRNIAGASRRGGLP
jgi:putative ABC transport system permease protein